jgi:hypothetical protein
LAAQDRSLSAESLAASGGRDEARLMMAWAAIAAATLAVIALAVVHLLKRELHPGRTMISRYALGRWGWVMALCFASFAVASASLFLALVSFVPSPIGRIGLAFLAIASVGLAMAAAFPMDPVSTQAAAMSFTGKMHGLAFMVGAPGMLLAVLLISLALVGQASHGWLPILPMAALVWLTFGTMTAVMLMVGPGKPPDPNGPERFIGLPNRLFMVTYACWLIVTAWPMVR